MGYSSSVFPSKHGGHAWLDKDGNETYLGAGGASGSLHRSPHEAWAAAARHYDGSKAKPVVNATPSAGARIVNAWSPAARAASAASRKGKGKNVFAAKAKPFGKNIWEIPNCDTMGNAAVADVYQRADEYISNARPLPEALRVELEAQIDIDFPREKIVNAAPAAAKIENTAPAAVTDDKRAAIRNARQSAWMLSAEAGRSGSKDDHAAAKKAHEDAATMLENCGHAECIENAKAHRAKASEHAAKA